PPPYSRSRHREVLAIFVVCEFAHAPLFSCASLSRSFSTTFSIHPLYSTFTKRTASRSSVFVAPRTSCCPKPRRSTVNERGGEQGVWRGVGSGGSTTVPPLPTQGRAGHLRRMRARSCPALFVCLTV